ncbi:MAG: hypothetical protein HQ559_09665, partial [Lentisphaerae bacterium]|nr:hypothetical protein [Lentisphaerota bacterium]
WYHYRVKAVNAVGDSAWSQVASVRTSAGAQNTQGASLVDIPDGSGRSGPRLILRRSRTGTSSNGFRRAGEEGGLVIRWSSVSGRGYRLQKRSSLDAGTWETVGANIPATPPENTITIERLDAVAFYRIVVTQ